MRQIVLTPSFRRAHKRLIKRSPDLKQRLDTILTQMATELFHPSLGTHKLSGNLSGYWACSCGYDCRVLFAIEVDHESGGEVLVLIDIGKHDEVY